MIHFTQLWGLLALVSLPLLILLFVLRPKRKSLMISSNNLWQEAINERQRGQGLQKLLRDLSLLLTLLFALLLGLGLAGMGWSLPSTERDDVVVILDVSASMQASGVGKLSRFEDAKNQVAKVINGLGDNGRMLLISSGRGASIRTAFESDRSVLGRALEEVQVTDEAGDPKQAILLALSLLQKGSHGKVYFVTDGAFDGVDNLDTTRVEYKRVEGPSRNVAITRFDFRAEIGSDERHQVLITARNYTDEQLTPVLRIELDDVSLLTQTLQLEPYQEKTLVLPVQGPIVGVARAVLDIEDDFARDNEAFAVLESSEALRILLVSAGNIYLDSVLAALPDITVVRRQQVPPDWVEQSADYDVIILDGIEPVAELPAGSYLLINTSPAELVIAEQGYVNNPSINGVGISALMEDIDLTGLRINRSRKIVHKPESAALQRLFWSTDTSLALAAIADRKKMIWLSFDLAESNFPLHAAYPLFLSQSLEWLHPHAARAPRTQIAAGESINIPAPTDKSKARVRTPSGTSLDIAVSDGQFNFQATAESGIYYYSFGQREYPFAVNLSNEKESDILPRAQLSVVENATLAAKAAGRVDIPLWPWLIAAALCLLVLEWCVWCWRGASA